MNGGSQRRVCQRLILKDALNARKGPETRGAQQVPGGHSPGLACAPP
jgi:hypothetical protein